MSIFDRDVVFVPINQGNTHWTSAAIFIKQKVIRYYDSMAGNGMSELRTLRKYLVDEWNDKKERHKLDESTKPVPKIGNSKSREEVYLNNTTVVIVVCSRVPLRNVFSWIAV